MLDLKILGFLDDGPLHGYELRRRIRELDGPGSRLSEGTLYPALRRLERDGFVEQVEPPRTGADGAQRGTRRPVRITEAGHAHLLALLRHPEEDDVASQPRFLVILAFLSRLPDAADRRAVLRRRLEVLEGPAPRFFVGPDGSPVRSAQETDPYRLGMLRVASGSRRAELEWLRLTLAREVEPGSPGDGSSL